MRRILAIVVAVACVTLGVVGISAPAQAATKIATATVLTQKAKVSWYGSYYTKKHPKNSPYQVPVSVPGIGTVTLVCSMDSTMLLLKPSDTGTDSTPSASARAKWHDTDMWLAKYENKVDGKEVAVKTVRVYPYDTAQKTNDPGHTGISAHEGFNQQNGTIENSSSGSMDGVISQRVNRRTSTLSYDTRTKTWSQKSVPPPTSFHLTWAWNGFRGSIKKAGCTVSATFTTNISGVSTATKTAKKVDTARYVTVHGSKVKVGAVYSTAKKPSALLRLNWHGNSDAAHRPSTSTVFPGVGTLKLNSPTGINSKPTFSVTGAASSTKLAVTTIQAEGLVPLHAIKTTYTASGGTIGPVPLPGNGILQMTITVGSTSIPVMLSSMIETNHVDDGKIPVVDSNGNPVKDKYGNPEYIDDSTAYNLTEVSAALG